MQHMELLEVTWLKCWLKELFSLYSLRSFLFSKYQYTRLVLIKNFEVRVFCSYH